MKRDIQRRLSERIRTADDARLVAGESYVVQCKIIDLSANGARLEVPWRSQIPKNVTLCVPARRIEHPVEIVWNSGDEVGVHFLFDEHDPVEVVHLRPATPPALSAPAPNSTAARSQLSDRPAPQRISELKALTPQLLKKSGTVRPPGRKPIFRRQIIVLTLAIVGIFCALTIVRSHIDLDSLLDRHSITAGDAVEHSPHNRQIGLNDKSSDAGASFVPKSGVSLDFLVAPGRPADKISRTESDDFRGAASSGSHLTSALSPNFADIAQPAAFAKPLASGAGIEQSPSHSTIVEIPISRPLSTLVSPSPAAAAHNGMNRDGASWILSVSQLDKPQLKSIENCLASVLGLDAPIAQKSLPNFVFANECLRERVIATQRAAK